MADSQNPSPEDSLIARYFKPLATDPGAFGLVDDAAVLSSSGDDIVVTTDAVVEGVHYLATDPPDTIARKALRVNLSDLAAKGAVPAGFVLTLALRSKEDAWLRPFADALGEDAKTFVCPLLGGETLISRYRVPQPRNALAQSVRDHATAAMDVSDGLAGDLTKLCAASGVSATIDVTSVPLSAAAAGLIARNVVSVETLLAGGDDYEVLCTVPPAQGDALIALGRAAGLAVTAIGTIVAGHERPRFLDGQGQELVLKRLSYSHF